MQFIEGRLYLFKIRGDHEQIYEYTRHIPTDSPKMWRTKRAYSKYTPAMKDYMQKETLSLNTYRIIRDSDEVSLLSKKLTLVR